MLLSQYPITKASLTLVTELLVQYTSSWPAEQQPVQLLSALSPCFIRLAIDCLAPCNAPSAAVTDSSAALIKIMEILFSLAPASFARAECLSILSSACLRLPYLAVRTPFFLLLLLLVLLLFSSNLPSFVESGFPFLPLPLRV